MCTRVILGRVAMTGQRGSARGVEALRVERRATPRLVVTAAEGARVTAANRCPVF